MAVPLRPKVLLRLPREESQGGLPCHTLSMRAEPGNSWQGTPDCSSNPRQRPAFHCGSEEPGQGKRQEETGLQWRTELRPVPEAGQGLPHTARETCKQRVQSSRWCDSQLLGGNTVGPPTAAWYATAIGSLIARHIRDWRNTFLDRLELVSYCRKVLERESTLSKWQMNQNRNFQIWEGKEETTEYKKIYKWIFIETSFGRVKNRTKKALFGIVKDKTKTLEVTVEWFSSLWYNHMK